MKHAKRTAARTLCRFCDTMNGYIGREITRAAMIAIVTLPGCYLFMLGGILLSR